MTDAWAPAPWVPLASIGGDEALATTVGNGSSDTDANVLPSVQFEAPPTRSASTAQSAKVTGPCSGAPCANGTLSPVVTSRHVSQQHVAKRSRESASTRADALRLRIGRSFKVVVGNSRRRPYRRGSRGPSGSTVIMLS